MSIPLHLSLICAADLVRRKILFEYSIECPANKTKIIPKNQKVSCLLLLGYPQ